MSRGFAKSTFLEDFRSFFSEVVPEERRTFDWCHLGHDPQGLYSVDCRVNGMPKPLFIFALPTDGKTRDATISILQFEKWGIPFRSVGIFEDQEEVGRRPLARFTDVCDRQFSSLTANSDRLRRFVAEALESS